MDKLKVKVMEYIKLKKESGFTLIEVMVSVLILSVGLLGLASLHVVSLKNNQSAQYRTEATIWAYSMLDVMRLDRDEAIASGYNVGFGPIGVYSYRTAEIASWKTSLMNSIKGDGSIAVDGLGVVTIVIQWDDSRGTDGNSTQQLAVSAQI